MLFKSFSELINGITYQFVKYLTMQEGFFPNFCTININVRGPTSYKMVFRNVRRNYKKLTMRNG